MFEAKIETGNEAMQSPYDVAQALRRIATKLDRDLQAGTVLDENGNTVGSWTFEP